MIRQHPLHAKFRIPALRSVQRLVQTQLVRGRAAAEALYLQDPTPESFACPSDSGSWIPAATPLAWGQRQGWTAFRARMRAPSEWNAGAVELVMLQRPGYRDAVRIDDHYPAGPEGQVFVDGQRVGAVDAQHRRLRLPFEPGRAYDVRAVFFAGRCELRHELEHWRLEWVAPEVERFYHDLRVLLDVAVLLPEADPAREGLLAALEQAVARLDLRGVSETAPAPSPAFRASLPAAQAVLEAAYALPKAAAGGAGVRAVGHAHIDLAWLWPIRQTRHKCVRTFATQCRLLDQYPGFVFLQSQPQAYAWVAQEAPDLFERIRRHVAAGRWEVEGASWVEMDTNVTGQESLVRQLLYGKRFIREAFGLESKVLWLPDVFGYSAALPQLLRLAGIDAFVTSKISWNQYNRFPYDTFAWRGLDGSVVAAHFITTPWAEEGQYFSTALGILTYNARLTAAEVKGCWEVYRGKSLGTEALMSFGWGDGGGGPTEEMLETGTRLERLGGVGAVPALRMAPIGPLMARLSERLAELPVWDGELYLEYHRGTYTTQAWLKRANRKNEIRLHNLEWLAVLARPLGFEYDRAAVESLWKDLLLCQFHDILPGSSVGEVYRDEVRPMQERIAAQTEAMTAAAAARIVERLDTTGARQPVALFNTLSWDRSDPVRLPDGTWRDDITVPAGGWSVADAAAAPPPADEAPRAEENGRLLVNRFWRLRLGSNGEIVELYDRLRARQVLAPGARGNEWQIFDDRPNDNDAWDIDAHYQDRRTASPRLTALRTVENGPRRAAVALCWEVPGVDGAPATILRQELALYAAHPRIDFRTEVDWHAHHRLLKVAFPVAIRSREATYEIQFGHLQRPTHANTSWDFAQFEVCAQRFVDLSEHGYGVALLNDGKYGFDVEGGTMRMTCIKSPQMPDATADQGRHEFAYALLPHAGTFQEAGVVRAAAEFNTPPIAVAAPSHGGDLPPAFAALRCDTPAIVVDTIKPAEDGQGRILRLYEAHGSRGRATLTLATAPRAVSAVNLLEEPSGDERLALRAEGNRIGFDFLPFQVISLRVGE